MTPQRKNDEDSNDSPDAADFASKAFWVVLGFVAILVGIIYQGLASQIADLGSRVTQNSIDIAVVKQSLVPSGKREP